MVLTHGLPTSSLEPGTTSLDHPPSHVFLEPPMEETTTPEHVSTLQTATQHHHATKNLRHLVGELKAGLYDQATNQERVLHTATPHVDVLAVLAGEKALAYYTPVMLDKTKGVLDVAGYVP